MAPVYFFLGALGGIGVFLNLLREARSPKESFGLGWFFGFGYFLGGLYWVSIALWVDIKNFWGFFPLALFGLPAVLAFYTALIGYAAFYLPKKQGMPGALGVGALWVFYEGLRGQLFTGFPWNLLGYSWGAWDVMMQPAALLGPYGLSFAVFIVVGVAESCWGYIRTKDTSPLDPIMLGLCVAFIVFLGGYGWHHLTRVDQLPWSTIPVKGRLVQANISQFLKWQPQKLQENFYRHILLSQRTADVSFIIWPEAAMPASFLYDAARLKDLQDSVPAGGVILFGVPRFYGPKRRTLANSVVAMDDKGVLYPLYDKSHLVPFGEYVPFQEWVKIPKITQGLIPFTPGNGVETISFQHLPPFSPLICYEIIFPGKVVHKRKKRPHWILNITNDGWYGHSSGPYQHLGKARFRAVEEGIPVIRAANTGISAVIDAGGRIIQQLPLGKAGIIDFILPPFFKEPTLYHKRGNLPCMALILFFLLMAHRRFFSVFSKNFFRTRQ